MFRIDQIFVDALARALAPRWVGKRLHAIERLGDEILLLRLRDAAGMRPELLLAAWPGRALLFASAAPIDPPLVDRQRDRAFGPALEGARIEGIESLPGERTLRIETQSRSIGSATLDLVAAGQRSGAILRAGEMTLAEIGRPRRAEPASALRPSTRTPREGALDRLRRARPGASALLMHEALHRSGIDRRAELSELPRPLLDTLDALESSAAASTAGYLYATPDDATLWSPILLAHLEAAPSEEAADPVAAGAMRGAEALARRLVESGRQEALRVIRRRDKQLRRRRRHLQDDIERAARSELLRRRGEAILAALPTLSRGMTQAALIDHHSGESIDVPLDPALDPAANAERAFKEARKAADGKAHARRRLAECGDELARLERLRELAESASTPEELRPLATLAPRLGRSRTGGDARTKPSPAPRRRKKGMLGENDPRWRRYLLPGDWLVLAARNARDNDLLTQKVAHMSDLWFHARGCPGSHVVLRCAQHKERPPKEIIEAAAAIAAYHSKARGSRLVPVAHAAKRHVRKPKGAKSGLVFMKREVVTFVAPALPAGYRH